MVKVRISWIMPFRWNQQSCLVCPANILGKVEFQEDDTTEMLKFNLLIYLDQTIPHLQNF